MKAIILIIGKLLAGLVEYLSNRQLLKAGAAEQAKESLEAQVSNVQKAKSVEQVIRNNPASVFTERMRAKYERSEQ